MNNTYNNTADTQVQDAANEWWNLIGWTARRSLGRKYHPGLDLTKLLDNEILSIYLKETSLPSTKAQKNITPSDFTVCPMGSVCQKSEAEPIAANIMVILKRTGNIFRKLTWEEYKDERLKDTGLSSDEASYFNMIIDYCTDAKSASLFSPVWKEIYDKGIPEPSTKEEAEADLSGNKLFDTPTSLFLRGENDKLKADNEALVKALKEMVNIVRYCNEYPDYVNEVEEAKALLNTIESNK